MYFTHHQVHGHHLIIIRLLYDPHSCLYIILLKTSVPEVSNISKTMFRSMLISVLEYELQLVYSVIRRLLDDHFMVWYCYPIVPMMVTKVRITAANIMVN